MSDLKKVIQLQSILVTSLNSHGDLLGNMKMFAQLIIKDNIFLQTMPVLSDDRNSWKFWLNCNIPPYAPTFSVAVLRQSETEGKRIVGHVELRQDEVLGSMESNRCSRCIHHALSIITEDRNVALQRELNKVNLDGPCLKLSAGFSAFELPYQEVSGLGLIGIPDNTMASLDISSQLRKMYEDLMNPQIGVDSLQLWVLHGRILMRCQSNGERARWLNFLAHIFLMSHKASGSVVDLNQAICAFYDAFRDELGNAMYLADLGISFLHRYDRLGSQLDIDQSVRMLKTAVAHIPDVNPGKHLMLFYLGNSHLRLFERLGDLDNLQQSILRFEAAVALFPDDDPHKPEVLNNLGKALLRRYERLSNLEDLNQLVLRLEAAVALTPDGHPDKPEQLNNLGISLLRRFERLDNLHDLNKCVLRFEAAVALTPDGHVNKHSRLNNLGSSLLRRYERIDNLDDLNQSILRKEASVALTPDNNPAKPSWLNSLGSSLLRRFDLLGDPNDLNQAVLRGESAVALAPDSHPDKAAMLGNLGNSLVRRFDRLGDLDDLNRSVSRFETALALTPDGHPNEPLLLNDLGNSLLKRFKQTGDHDDLNNSVMRKEAAVAIAPDSHPKKSSWLDSSGNSLLTRFDRFGDPDDLNKSIVRKEAAVVLTPDKPLWLDSLASSLLRRFDRLGDLDDLNQSILRYEAAVSHTPDDHPYKCSLEANLGNSLFRRFQQLGDLDDLNQSVLRKEAAVALAPDGHPDKAVHLNDFGNSLMRRFQQLSHLDDLNQSVLKYEAAVALILDDHPSKPQVLNNLGKALLTCYNHSGDLNNLNQSVLRLEAAVSLTPDGHPDKPEQLNNLGISLLRRFEKLGDLNDLNQSVLRSEAAVALTLDDHPDKPSWLDSLVCSLLRRFEQLGDLNDLNQSVLSSQAAVALTLDDHPDKPSWLDNLGNSLLMRFEQLGDLDDLNRSILRTEAAVALTPDDHPARPSRLSNLGNSLLRRFDQLNDLDDLNQSILRYEAAISLTLNGPHEKGSLEGNLGNSLFRRFHRLGNLDDLNQSILRKEAAVALLSDGHPDKLGRLNNLANSLMSRFQRLGHLDDLNQSVLRYEAALALTPDGHSEMPALLDNIGVSRLIRFQRLGDLDDLNQSILSTEAAVASTPDGHPIKPSLLNNLGNAFLCRFKQLHHPEDSQQLLIHLTSAACSKTGPANIRFNAAKTWAAHAHINQSPSILHAYSTAIELLPELVWLGLSISDRHHLLSQVGVVVRNAASAAIAVLDYQKAVEWLDQGCSVIWGQLLDLRTPLDELRKSHPDLANQLLSLSTSLENVGMRSNTVPDANNLQLLDSVAQHSHALVFERDCILQQIRGLTGFEKFLLPKSISELSRAADLGPVVILNISAIGCDALILMPGLGDKVIHVPLNDFTIQEAQHLSKSLASIVRTTDLSDTLQFGTASTDPPISMYVGRGWVKGPWEILDLSQPQPMSAGSVEADSDRLQGSHEKYMAPDDTLSHVLSELWLKIVRPVLNALAVTTPKSQDLGRIWWCPTGPLSFLPIHAAGFYGSDQAFGSKLSDFLISSYTPSLTALIHAFRPPSEVQTGLQLLVVTQPSAEGQPYIPGTEEEIKCIKQYTKGKVPVLWLHKDKATIENVQKGMKESRWVHFACHGVQSVSPTENALLLAGSSRMTLSDIIKLSLPNADLAFLSACQTATGSKKLQDESVHLAAGMLLAGYRGVIGTMWSIKDHDAPQVAGDVYAHLLKTSSLDPAQAAEALHLAVRKLQEQIGAKSFLRWVPFIHFGV